MAARKPRSFARMRDDRVIAMARARFGRDMSRTKAVAALSRLPVAAQHALVKPRSPMTTPVSMARAGALARQLAKSPAVRVLGVAAPVAIVAAAAWEGSSEDQNRVRGAVRGALKSLDVTSRFMTTGLVQRWFDGRFGEAVAPEKRPDFEKLPDRSEPVPKRQIEAGAASGSRSAFLDQSALARSLSQSPLRQAPRRDVVADTSTGGRTYTRTYTRGPKAGTTETIRIA